MTWVRFRKDMYVFPDMSERRAARVPANEPVWLESQDSGPVNYLPSEVRLHVRTEHGVAVWTCYLSDLKRQLKVM